MSAARFFVARPALLGAAALLAATLAAPRLLAEPLLRTVVLEGEYAPGTANRSGKFSAPVIDAAGRVAFAGELGGTDFDHDQGLWSEYQGRLQLMVRERTALPVAAPDSFFTYSRWQVYGDGRLSFATTPTQYVQGGPGNYQTTLKSINYDLLAVNDAGGLAYVTGDNQRLVRSIAGADVTVASVGQTLPGMPAGLTAREFLTPAFNDAGDLAFFAAASDAQGPAPWNGIWTYRGDALSPVALSNQVAPGAPDGRRFTGLRLPSLNGAGDVAFQAYVEGAAENGVWRTHNGQLELVAYRHQQPPGIAGDIDFDYFGDPAINDRGDVAFRAQLKGALPNPELDNGIWVQHDGQLRSIMYAGMPVPEAPAGSTFYGGPEPQINNAGHVVFHSGISPGINGSQGIFAYSVLGDYLWSIKSGDEIEVADNVFRTVTDLVLATPENLSAAIAGATQDGRRSPLNDAGQLAFEAFFSDRSQGVFVVQLPSVPNLTQVPEPSAWLLMSLGGLAVLGTARRKRPVRLAGGEPLERRDLLTVAPEMLANVGLTEYPDAWSSPAEFMQLGGLTLFAASSQDGRELWRSDGSAAGTQQVLNINPSYYSSDPDQLTRLGDRVFFTAFADPFGRELWQTDGTAAGTKLVVDLATNASAQPQELTVWGTRLAFTAETKALGRELYVYDPAANKTALVADLQPGLIGSVPSGLTVFGDKLLFVADDGVHGRELWAASPDGGVQLLQDLHLGAAHAFPATRGEAPLAIVGEWAYFAADDGVHGTELWRTNGLPGGANLVADLLEGPVSASPRSLTPVAGGLAFRANDGAHGTELWFTTGDAAGTRLVADIAPGTPTSAGRDLLAVGNNLYFVADDGVHGLELWVSNLTAAGTRMVADIAPGAEDARPEQLVAWNGAVYFTAQTSSLGRELWRTDGSTAGTVNVADLNPGGADGVERVALAGDRLWLAANDGVAGQEPWTLAADAQTPALVSDIGKRRVQSGRYLDGFVAAGDYVYFTALNSVSGAELWKTAGTPETTGLLIDLAPGSDGAAPESLTEYRGLLYFTAYDAVKGRQLWQTDGTAAGTQLVVDLPVNAAPRELTVANGQLFFVADDNATAELWRLDRRVDPLALPVKLQPQESPLSQVAQLTSAAGRLYFVAHTEARGTEVWSTDGNIGSLQNVVYSVAQPAGGELRLLAATGPSLFFLQQTPAGANLWQTDALGASAFLQVDAADASRPRIDLPTTRFVISGVHLYFTASNEFAGEELWRTTSPFGTNKVGIVADINPGAAGSQPTELTVLGDEVFFVANDGVHGPAIWRTNGEFGGTSLVVDVDPSKSTADQPAQLTAVDHWLYFTATNRTLGVELWRTDVLGSGADRVADLWPGDQSSRPLDLSYLGGSLYFSALTPGLERMPFVLSYATPLPGDANFDGSVNLSDFGVLKAHFGEPGPHEDGDFNGDGRIDLSDFGMLKQNFGAVWPAATPAVAVAETEVETVRSTPAAAASLLPAAAWSVAADALFANLGGEPDRAPEEPF